MNRKNDKTAPQPPKGAAAGGNSNIITAVLLSLGILLAFHYLYEKPQMEKYRLAAEAAQQAAKAAAKNDPAVTTPTAPALRDRAAIIAEGLQQGLRVPIDTPALHGSINRKGARIDDVTLATYREDIDKHSPEIVMLSPAGSIAPHQAYYGEFGWLGQDVVVPDANTVWQADGAKLSPSQSVKLSWDNGHGLLFERSIAVDDKFMFTITDRVKNNGGDSATLYPFGLIARHGKPKTEDIYIMHEGPIGVLGGQLTDPKYADVMEKGKITASSEGGWVGLTDKYWLVALAPPHNEAITATFTYDRGKEAVADAGVFQSDFRGTSVTLAKGAVAEHSQRFFVGAKELRTLSHYERAENITRLSDAIDFGWYWFFTKPFLFLLDVFGENMGNFGLAILAFTVILKLLTLPLSLKSYRSMAKMRELQPQIKELQERFKEDRQQLGLETMALYKREKVNPMSGCLPNLIQIPIFFALYKILYVGIELRHAPFYGWIHDLSAPDPTSVLTLFGMIDLAIIPHVGIWPILMGVSMFVQMRLSPQPPDKTQARVFMFLPLIFTFMMGQMAAGLIIYWTWSNLIGLGQQWLIMHRVGGLKKAPQ